jgi:hypothetical protein
MKNIGAPNKIIGINKATRKIPTKPYLFERFYIEVHYTNSCCYTKYSIVTKLLRY